MREQTVLEGTVENIVYKNTLNGYCVFEMSVSSGDYDEVVCTGNVPAVAVGETIKVVGSFTVHHTYGRQLAVELYEKTAPSTESGMIKYLGSGVIRGVREKTARKIVERFGADTFDVIADYPEKLTEIKGLSLERAMSISAVFHEQAQMRRVIVYLQGLGVSNAYAMKIYKRYKDRTIETVQSNPYRLADDIFGVGFKVADEIAEKAGFGKDSPHRVEAGVKYVLNQAAGNGHVYLPKDMLIAQAAELLELPGALAENSLARLQMERAVWQEKLADEQVVYLNVYYYAENNVAKKLAELSANVVKKSRNVMEDIDAFEEENGLLLAEGQKRAVVDAMDSGVLVITGGPGTGKTTAINTVISIMQKRGMSVELAAPTGRAAKRMTEATGIEAKTIHRLLEISFKEENGANQRFGKNKDNLLEADAVIIDESSMVDILLMNSLLSAMAPGTRLILVGDVDQLPSVGPGNVLKDIIGSGRLPVARLTEIFRQAQESAIVMNAHRINRGEYPVLNEKSRDFFFTRKATVDGVLNTIVALVTKRLPSFAGCDPLQDIQVLSPMRKSPLGAASLNRVLQQALNPPGPGKNEREFRQVAYREGDKVMQVKNNYNMTWKAFDGYARLVNEGLGVFNGDVGVIRRIDDFNEIVSVLFDDNRQVDYDYAQLDELELAYAITIHKSQGSEYKVVVMPIHSGPPMLMSRNLLYTGVTRAKELTVIVGMEETLRMMIGNKRESGRFSALNQRIVKMHDMLSGAAE